MPFNTEPSPYLANETLAQNYMMPHDTLMPMYFGNPFFTYFDESNSLCADFSATMGGYANTNFNVDTDMGNPNAFFPNQGPNVQ